MNNISKALAIEGWMAERELLWLAEKASLYTKILEIGTYKGRTTRVLCDNTKGKVTTVDIDGHYEFYNSMIDHVGKMKVHIIRDTSCNAFIFFKTNKLFFDMIFIDGDHSYETVVQDINNASQVLKDGGLLCGHDFNETCGVKQAVIDLIPDYKIAEDTGIWYR